MLVLASFGGDKGDKGDFNLIATQRLSLLAAHLCSNFLVGRNHERPIVYLFRQTPFTIYQPPGQRRSNLAGNFGGDAPHFVRVEICCFGGYSGMSSEKPPALAFDSATGLSAGGVIITVGGK
jgi:hypothetical protein